MSSMQGSKKNESAKIQSATKIDLLSFFYPHSEISHLDHLHPLASIIIPKKFQHSKTTSVDA